MMATMTQPFNEERNGIRTNFSTISISETLDDAREEGYMVYNPRTLLEQARIASSFFNWGGRTPQGQMSAYMQKTKNAMRIMEQAQMGSLAGRTLLREAISYDDFNYIMQDTIYRKMMEKWEVPDAPLPAFAREIKVPTMQRPGKLFTLDGLETPIPLVHPGQQPETRYPYDSGIAIRPYKYMADVELLWETMIEDDLNALSDIPSRLDNAVKVTLGRIYSQLYAKKTGWKDDAAGDPFYVINNDKILNPTLAAASAAGIDNKLLANMDLYGTAANARLSLPALQAARSQVAKFLSPDKNPISVKVMHLVVGVGQEEVAKNILNAQSYVMERAGGIPSAGGPNSGFVRMEARRDAIAGINLHVDPYLHVIVDGSTSDKMWMMVASPDISRPIFAYCVLAGYEKPILQRRVPNYRGIGMNNGQSVDWISTGFRVGFIRGIQWGDARGAIASDGSA